MSFDDDGGASRLMLMTVVVKWSWKKEKDGERPLGNYLCVLTREDAE